MHDKRKHARWETSFYFEPGREYTSRTFDIIDRESKEQVGILIDLTNDGLGVEAHHQMQIDRIYTFEIGVPGKTHPARQIIAAARCVWCVAGEGGKFRCGFEIIAIAPPYGEVIDLLIAGEEAPES